MECKLCKEKISATRIHFYCIGCCKLYCKSCIDPPLRNVSYQMMDLSSGGQRRSTKRLLSNCGCITAVPPSASPINAKDISISDPPTLTGILGSLENIYKTNPVCMIFGSLNIRGIANADKLSELRCSFSADKTFCLGVQETHLDSSYPDGLICFPGCHVYRRDRAVSFNKKRAVIYYASFRGPCM